MTRISLASCASLAALLLLSGVPSAVSGAEKVDLAGLEASGGLVPAGRGIAAADGAQAGAEGPLQMASFDTPLSVRLRSLAGLLLLVGLAWGLSVNRKLVPWRVVLWGLGLQLLFAVAVLKTGAGQAAFAAAGDVVVTLLGFTAEGARMVFGDLVYDTVPIGTGSVGQGGFEALPGQVARTGASFAFSVLPTIIFFSSLMAVLYHLGIMQLAVRGVAWVMQRTMRTSGAETLSAAGNVFVGMTEAPLLVKPFVERMTNSELMAVMTGGFATVAGGVMAAYVSFLYPFVPGIAGHLIAASVMSAPAALLVAKVMMPEEAVPETVDVAGLTVERSDANVIDAAARGAGKGLELALNVGAMLLAFVALIQLANGVLGWAGSLVGWDGLAFEVLLGWVLAPLAWMMGVSWADAPTIGGLLGVKTVLNEFVAYVQLTDMVAGGRSLEPRSVVIATYALSGFANFGSIAMQLGGIGGIAPSRRSDLARLGVRAMIGGSIAAFMTASVAGMLL